MENYYQNIKKNILTHYVYDIYPTKQSATKILPGVKRKPQIQRKMTKPSKPAISAQMIITAPVAKIKPIAQRKKFRKNINKDALAKYFDNYALPTNAQIAQGKQAEWLMQTIQELDAADKIHAQAEYDAMYNIEQRYALYDRLLKIYPEMQYDNSIARGPRTSILTMPDENFAELKKAVETIEAVLIISAITTIHTFITVMNTPEKQEQPTPVVAQPQPKNTIASDDARIGINESIADRFMKKYHGADTAAAMRALYQKQRTK